MYKNGTIFQKASQLIDVLLIALCMYGASYLLPLIAPHLNWEISAPPANLFEQSPYASVATIIIAVTLLSQRGFYRSKGLQTPLRALHQIFVAWIVTLAGIALYQMSCNSSENLRHLIWINVIIIPIVLYCRYAACYFYISCVNCSPSHLKSVILMGNKEDVLPQWENLPHGWKRSFSLAGVYDPSLHSSAELQQMLIKHSVSCVIIFSGLHDTSHIEETSRLCELLGLDVYIGDSIARPFTNNVRFERVSDYLFCIHRNAPILSWGYIAKNILDRIGALILLILTSPLWLFATVCIKISDPKGSVFYKQKRSGMYGKEFTMWKFRSMYTDADKRLDEVKKTLGNDMNGPLFKLENDPRIIPIGKFLRKTSIDELPQLLNILKGDMSLVGPRPLVVYETAAFPDLESRRRLIVKPGLTCYWQIEGRSNTTDFKDLIEKDLKYIDNWNFWLDIWLLLRTIPVVLLGKGAK